MIPTIEFFVEGDPKGQPRPRAFALNGKARIYDPGTAEGWKGCIAEAAREHLPQQPLDGPLKVDIEFRFKRPKSHFLKAGLRPGAAAWHTGKPDRDNLEKAVLDALTTLGMWRDDSQVCAGEIRKRYANWTPGAKVTIREAGE